jgi:hypothetical protein
MQLKEVNVSLAIHSEDYNLKVHIYHAVHDSFKLGTDEATVSSDEVAHGSNEEGVAGSESSSQNQQHGLIQFQPQRKEKRKESYKIR